MRDEDQARVRAYLATWTEADWDDLWNCLAVMSLPRALVAVHRARGREMVVAIQAPESARPPIETAQLELAV